MAVTERVVCGGCGHYAAWRSWFWGWVCPGGDIVSEQTGRVIGSLNERQPVSAWRQVGDPWPEDSEARHG